MTTIISNTNSPRWSAPLSYLLDAATDRAERAELKRQYIAAIRHGRVLSALESLVFCNSHAAIEELAVAA